MSQPKKKKFTFSYVVNATGNVTVEADDVDEAAIFAQYAILDEGGYVSEKDVTLYDEKKQRIQVKDHIPQMDENVFYLKPTGKAKHKTLDASPSKSARRNQNRGWGSKKNPKTG